jgi:anti-sigma factor ChrR (cupin superfamily)
MEQLFQESVNCKMLARCELANVILQKNAYKQGSLSPTHAHSNARFVFVLRGKFSEVYGSKSSNAVLLRQFSVFHKKSIRTIITGKG